MPNSNLDRSNSNGITVINEFTAKPAKVPAMVPLAYGILCELKKTVKEAETVKEEKDSPSVSIADKYSLSIQEAAEYYGIGEKRLRSIISEHYNEPFILEIGSHQRIKRRLFEEFLDQATAV
ncbi:excisionase [Butyrivibrio sp.]|uniref:excisionase n=1 Tax=Butyrivibrio sp. TaxID=28121 RepID=UPI0025BBC927|nr:excisionase [Butyrivibrio sp.]